MHFTLQTMNNDVGGARRCHRLTCSRKIGQDLSPGWFAAVDVDVSPGDETRYSFTPLLYNPERAVYAILVTYEQLVGMRAAAVENGDEEGHVDTMLGKTVFVSTWSPLAREAMAACQDCIKTFRALMDLGIFDLDPTC